MQLRERGVGARELPICRFGALFVGTSTVLGKCHLFFSQFPLGLLLLASVSAEPLSCVPTGVASLWLALASKQLQLISTSLSCYSSPYAPNSLPLDLIILLLYPISSLTYPA